MRVSVVVPVYNVAPYLRQCMDSLVGQTLREIEIICIDDGSTDGSGAVLDEYAAKDPRVKVIHQANAGAGAARNVGLDLATGEYLFFCDPDDWCAPDLLAQMADCARSVSADVVLAGYTQVDAASGRVIGTHPPHRRWPQDSVFSGHDVRNRVFNLARHTVWDKLFRREFVLANGIRFQPVRHYNDMLFCDLSLGLARRMTVLPVTGYMHVLSRPGGLQDTAPKSPGLILEVYRELKRNLRKRSLMRVYRRSYLLALAKSSRDVIRRTPRRAVGFRMFWKSWRMAVASRGRFGIWKFLRVVKPLLKAGFELLMPIRRRA